MFFPIANSKKVTRPNKGVNAFVDETTGKLSVINPAGDILVLSETQVINTTDAQYPIEMSAKEIRAHKMK